MAQTYNPYEFVRAVKGKTRTWEGIPGVNYFQNYSEYQIEVEMDLRKEMLSGTAHITYFNNSPDTLTQLVLKIYQNIHKKGGIRDQEVPASEIHDGVDLYELVIDGISYTHLKNAMSEEGTNVIIRLRSPIEPNSSAEIITSWKFPLFKSALHRFGRYNDRSYFIAYWYPQVAVYDDIDGWDTKNYTGTHETYNDFNSYEVSITVPKAYLVWATGEWQNPEAILKAEILRRFQEAKRSDETIEIITQKDLKEGSWMKTRKRKQYQFSCDSVPDFAFAISDNYVWDGISTPATNTNRKVFVQAAYPNKAKNFNQVAEIGRNAIMHFNDSSFGFQYPYSEVTVFNGDGGMEFPMMVNNSARFFRDATVFLTIHELAHAYFPFLTGINERKYAWLDEGITTYVPIETEDALNSNYYPIDNIVKRYELTAGTENDIPLSVSSYQTRGIAYQYHAYLRSSVALHMLEIEMGRDNFRSALKEFITIWQFKHSTPTDFFSIIKKHSEHELDNLIDHWFYGNGWPDVGLRNVSITGDSILFEIVKNGTFDVPVEVVVEYTDSSTADTMRYHAEIWNEVKVIKIQHALIDRPKAVKLNHGTIPDRERGDNSYFFPAELEPLPDDL